MAHILKLSSTIVGSAAASHRLRPATLPLTVCAAGNKSQKREGLYFEYEPVDPEAAKEIPIEKEKLKAEFDWVQKARTASRIHRDRREEDPGSRSNTGRGGGRQGRGGGGRGRGRGILQQQQQQEQQQQQKQKQQPQAVKATLSPVAAAAPSAPRPVPQLLPTAVAASAAAPAVVAAPAVAAASAVAAAPALTDAATSRKLRMMKRMQGASGLAGPGSAGPPAVATLSVAAAGPAAAASQQLSEASPSPASPQLPSAAPPASGQLPAATRASSPAARLPADLLQLLAEEEAGKVRQAMPSVPDVGVLDAEEEQVKAMLQGVFVDALEGDQAAGGGLPEAVSREVAAQREYVRWMEQLRLGDGEAGGEGQAAVFINLFVIAVFAHGFYDRADAPDEIGLENAGEYLGKTYGAHMIVIWALGLLAAGQSSTMTGTYTGQFVMQGYLNLKISPWARIAVTRSVAIVPALAVALAFDGAGGSGLDSLNQSLNLLQSVQLPFALLPLLLFTSNSNIMGKDFVNTALIAGGTTCITAMVIVINAWAVYQMVASQASLLASPFLMFLVVAGGLVYLSFLLYLVYLSFYRPFSGLSNAVPESEEGEREGLKARLLPPDRLPEGDLVADTAEAPPIASSS